MKSDHPLFEIVTTTAGAVSIRNKVLNETMHNPVGPWTEANALYIEPSKLREKLMADEDRGLVLFDVGLGAAANSLAALHCHRGLKKARRLRIVSFERETELLRFALEHADHFEHFKGFEPALASILEKGEWRGEGVDWHLRKGNFLDLIETEPDKADLVFYDPYSMSVNPEMWTVDCFKRLRRLCKGPEEGGALFFNYSRATPFRVALLLAGFFIGRGPETGLKDETTQAATRLSDLEKPLAGAWLERWKRSQAKLPAGMDVSDLPRIEEFLLNHVQFKA